MIIYNGVLDYTQSPVFTAQNRGLLYGDAVFETLRYSQGHIHFWEDHYFRLMATMRIFRMDIPMTFTPEFLEQECIRLIQAQSENSAAWRIRLNVYRKDGGAYLPSTKNVGYFIEAKALDSEYYLSVENYKVELFNDYYLQKSMLSNLKSNNKALQVIASIFMQEQGFDNGILVNDEKEVVEFLNGNLFIVEDGKLRTPPITSGCLDGIMRKQIIRIAKILDISCVEEPISPFDLQRVQELFMTNAIVGIQPVKSYRRTTYNKSISLKLQQGLFDLVSSNRGV
ncbi:MAG: aminotransferase class IV [Flavobacteriaceae bacterium]|nr:aminotransferase class IV [Flavobacteriaceae bacterium]|tara:strand:- start:7084 stop:7932 length:849 start_codon:yes stop_codon:yes gene_type:complete